MLVFVNEIWFKLNLNVKIILKLAVSTKACVTNDKI